MYSPISVSFVFVLRYLSAKSLYVFSVSGLNFPLSFNSLRRVSSIFFIVFTLYSRTLDTYFTYFSKKLEMDFLI